MNDLDLSGTGRTPKQPWDSEQGKAMQEKRTLSYREKREKRALEKEAAAAAVFDEVLQAQEAGHYGKASLDKMAENILRLGGNLILKGGPLYQPQSLKDVNEMVRTWAAVRAQYTAKNNALVVEPVQQIATDTLNKLVELKGSLEAKRVQPGRVQQITDEDELL